MLIKKKKNYCKIEMENTRLRRFDVNSHMVVKNWQNVVYINIPFAKLRNCSDKSCAQSKSHEF